MKRLIVVIGALTTVLCRSVVLNAAEWSVSSGDVTALTNALAMYAANDVIALEAGVYNLAEIEMAPNVHLVVPNRVVTMRGSAANETLLAGNGSRRIMNLSGNAVSVFSNLTFTGGHSAAAGGALFPDPSYGGCRDSKFYNCIISNNYSTASAGGAYWMRCYDCFFRDTGAMYNGGCHDARLCNQLYLFRK